MLLVHSKYFVFSAIKALHKLILDIFLFLDLESLEDDLQHQSNSIMCIEPHLPFFTVAQTGSVNNLPQICLVAFESHPGW